MVMGFESHNSPETSAESLPKISEGMVANMLQLQLMKLSYHANHPDTQMDMSDSQLRNTVAEEWTHQYAQAFREHIEDNPRATIDLGDEAALLKFLDQLEPQTTLH